MTFAVTATLFGLGGYWLDREFGTVPLFLLIGLFVGFIGGFVHLLSVVAPDLLPFRKNSDSTADDDRSADDDDTGR